MRKFVLCLFLLLYLNCFSQFSKTHYIPPLSSSNIQFAQAQFLYVSSPSLTLVNFILTPIGGTPIQGVVSRDQPYRYSIGSGNDTQLIINETDAGTIKNNKGFVVEAEDLVYVTVRLTAHPNRYQAGGLVSKGLAGLGTQFRIGAFTNASLPLVDGNHYTFGAILATENNTVVSFSDIKAGATLTNNTAVGNNPTPITLNKGESYIISVSGINPLNADALIGAGITATKPIVVNCGSFAGSNGTVSRLDLGFDQIVTADRTGTDYIFVRGNGVDETERPLIVANEMGTEVFLNGSSTAYTTLDTGQYLALTGVNFSVNGNLYIKTSKKAFAFQGIGGTTDQANQNMCFVPPLSCETPKIINNIPFINKIGDDDTFTGSVCLVTKTGATVDFLIDTIAYSINSLPLNINVQGPFSVDGNPDYVTYKLNGLTGNVSVFSSKQVYLSYFGSSGYATYGGYYSGFTFDPELSFDKLNTTLAGCFPNVKLSVNLLSGFDKYKWFNSNIEIVGETQNFYTPTAPGFYRVEATITECGTTRSSDEIPVSACPSNFDNDLANDNIDLDFDNDGISNCGESFGDFPIDLSSSSSQLIDIQNGKYTNSFSSTILPTVLPQIASITNNSDGSFNSAVVGKDNFIQQTINFVKPISLRISYMDLAEVIALANVDGEFTLQVATDKTITVLNPDGQLDIDTNYDGIFEPGISSYSSFQIRFRYKNGTPITGSVSSFSFRTNMVNSIIFTHKNISDSGSSRAKFLLVASCIPKDSDSDSIPDQFDLDSDNDGILDNYEFSSQNFVPVSNVDTNFNGLDDAYDNFGVPSDSDMDGVADYLDLDSDNDGVFDLLESGSLASDTNQNGIIDGINFGTNGLADSVQTTANSGVLNYILINSDSDNLANFVDLDSDGDNCFDVSDAGFSDPDKDGKLGVGLSIINAFGVVSNSINGYSTPISNYLTSALILINTPLLNIPICENSIGNFEISSTAVDSYQWQKSTDNITFIDLINSSNYTGVTTSNLQVNNVSPTMSSDYFRVFLNKNGNSCGKYSNSAQINVLSNPNIPSSASLTQCDFGLNPDGFVVFNLAEANEFFTSNDPNLTVKYFENNASLLSNTPLASNYTNTSIGQNVIAKVTNTTTGCSSLSNLILNVNVIPSQQLSVLENCDNLQESGLVPFDLTSAQIVLSATQSLAFYTNINDALLEQNAIATPNNYTNLTPYSEQIFVRIEDNNNCAGISILPLKVTKLPNIEAQSSGNDYVCLNKPNDYISIDAAVLSGFSSDYHFFWYWNGTLLQKTTYTIQINQPGTYTVDVYNGSKCFKTRTIIVHPSDIATIESVVVSDLSTENLTENYTATINLTNPIVAYEYSIDAPSGPFRADNVFENLTIGTHTAFVQNLQGCNIASREFVVVGYPKFFTPNGDGIHDVWSVAGINNFFNSNSIIYIFERTGKLITQITSQNSKGWNGNFEGKPLPADDYWFELHFGDGKIFRGHFSLLR